MRSLRFWQSLSLVLAGLCLWLGISRQQASQPADELHPSAAAVRVPIAEEAVTKNQRDGKAGRDQAQGAEATVQTAEVVLSKDLARRLSDRIGSPLTGTPPAPMQWDRDQLTLLGLRPFLVKDR